MSIDEIAIRLKKARKNAKMTQADVAAHLGITYQAISNYERGITRVDTDTLVKLCAVYNISVSDILGADSYTESDDSINKYAPGILPLPANKAYPLVGNIACGTPILAEENITEYIQFPGDLNADFCLRCCGDSMIDARIHDGDIVFIRQQPEAANGEIAAVQIGEEAATLKRVYRSDDGSTLTLMAANPAYPPMVYSGEQLASVRILGKAVNFLSTVK